jgi:membrane-associated phospholipid phosphatase
VSEAAVSQDVRVGAAGGRGTGPRAHDPVLLAGGAAVFLAGAALARRPAVSALEARLFRAVNGLPSAVLVPGWPVMQLGSLWGVAAGAVVAVPRSPEAARRTALWGTATWGGAKVLKRLVRRGRPEPSIGTLVRGRQQRGLGYPSGHAAVAAAVVSLAGPGLPPRWRTPLWVAALAAGPLRMYVGAHLPLDVAGGVALGLTVGAGSRLVGGQTSRTENVSHERRSSRS